MLVVARRRLFLLPRLPLLALLEPQTHSVLRVIQGSHQHVYRVVLAVDEYRQFIPFVEDSFINQRTNEGVPTEGGLRIGWQQFEERFVCQLECVPGQLVVAQLMTTALFDELYTKWQFTPMGPHMTKVDLNLKYKFKNPMYNAVSLMFSDQVTQIMIRAFEDRVKATPNPVAEGEANQQK